MEGNVVWNYLEKRKLFCEHYSEGLAGPQKGILSGEIRSGGDYQALLMSPDIPKNWILNTTKAFK